jgi:L-fuculose-phosphate aldolase
VRELDARRALVEVARRLDDAGLNHNSSGNLSVRTDRGIVVSPSGIPAHVLAPDDCVVLDDDGVALDRQHRAPTSEWWLHVALHRRGDVDAVVHTHSPEATAAATLARPVPAVHYVVARFGSTSLPCSPYATYGTAELAEQVVATLGTHGRACLMANHGAVAVGADLSSAMALALDVEWLCGVHRRACQLGEPRVLGDDEIERVARLFAGYGQPR